MSKAQWRVSGPHSYNYEAHYAVEEFKGYFEDSLPEDFQYTGVSIAIPLGEPSGEDGQGNNIYEREMELAQYIAGALNDREWKAYDEEAARINEREMWGDRGRPGGR